MKPIAVITQDDGEGQLIERYRSKQKYDMNMQPSWLDQGDAEPTTQLGEEKDEMDGELDLRVRRAAFLILANAYPAAPARRLNPQTSWTDHLYMQRTRNKLYVDKSVESDEYAGKPIWPTRDNPNNPSDDRDDVAPTGDYKVGTGKYEGRRIKLECS